MICYKQNNITMKTNVVFLFICMLSISCASNVVITPAEKDILETAIHTPKFTIDLEWAYALNADAGQLLNSLNPAGTVANGNRFYIQDGAYSFTVVKDSVSVNLPYFGTRQISGGLPGNTGINIEDSYSNWELKEVKKDSERTIDLRASEGGESYDITLILSVKGNATVIINSMIRESIRYTGTWE